MTDTLTLTLDRTQAYATMRALEHRIIGNIGTFEVEPEETLPEFKARILQSPETNWDLLEEMENFLDDSSSADEVITAIEKYYFKLNEMPF